MASKIDMHCTSCDRTFPVPCEWLGKLAQCPCGNQIRITDGVGEETESTPGDSESVELYVGYFNVGLTNAEPENVTARI